MIQGGEGAEILPSSLNILSKTCQTTSVKLFQQSVMLS